jgi:hypothetical protein
VYISQRRLFSPNVYQSPRNAIVSFILHFVRYEGTNKWTPGSMCFVLQARAPFNTLHQISCLFYTSNICTCICTYFHVFLFRRCCLFLPFPDFVSLYSNRFTILAYSLLYLLSSIPRPTLYHILLYFSLSLRDAA